MADRSKRQWLGIYLRGLAMGVAELIPGVSGGTIAFITGIYEELLRTLAGLNPRAAWSLWQDGPALFWRRHNLTFLLVLGLGMATAVLALARLLNRLLESAPILVWAFFFGLILAGAFEIGRRLRWPPLLSAGVVGLVCGALLSLLGAGNVSVSYPMLFLGGAVAISAWLLPGVSGSYILLLLGLYPALVAALAEWQLDRLVVLGLGMATGLVLFAQLLAFLMRRIYEPVMALLTGFMAGSLLMLWPWHLEIADGPGGRALRAPVAPWRFGAVTQEEPALLGAAIMALAGVLLVVLLSRARGLAPSR